MGRDKTSIKTGAQTCTNDSIEKKEGNTLTKMSQEG
jgi:hypothetical protein